jgi:hypothetical protein
MPTATEIAKDLGVAEIASAIGSNANAKAEVAKQRKRFYTFYKTAADAMASTASAVTTFVWPTIIAAGNVTKIIINSTAALTGHATDNAVITVNKLDAAGANTTAVGAITTTASWVAGTDVVVPLTAAAIAVVEGGSFNMAITKGGSGVVVPICSVTVVVEDT